MRKNFFIFFIFFLITTSFKAHHDDNSPVLFAKGIISTANDESGITFMPDGNTCFFTLKSPSTISSNIAVICVSYFKNNKWSEPEIASFSGKYHDFNPSISPDGSKLFFVSDRPVNKEQKFDTDIWMTENTGDGWSEPKNLGAPINTNGWEVGCSAAADGTLYFSSSGNTANLDLYKSRFQDGKYETPENIGKEINTDFNESDPFISPDQSYILFASQGRQDGLSEPGASIEYPRGDLYISFFKNGRWTTAKNLGAGINSTAEESNPYVSKDGSTLYFTSERNFVSTPMKQKLSYSFLENHLHDNTNGLGDIYKIPVSAFFKQSSLKYQTINI